MKIRWRVHQLSVVPIALIGAWALPARSAAQNPVGDLEWSIHPIRPAGQIVTPVFEGWYPNPDGSYSLSFGYYNMNTDEAVDIPLGPDNYIEPRDYDGRQPTHFDPIPSNGARRHWGVFTIQVPADIGDQRVVWHLTHRGKTFSIPGHIGSVHYMLEDERSAARGMVAPGMRFAPDGAEGRGPEGITAAQLTARVGTPLPLSVWVDPAPRPASLVWWFKHQGPGEITFSTPESEIAAAAEVTTTATFSEPGTYMIRVVAVEEIATLEFHCCWTNGYIQVTVTE